MSKSQAKNVGLLPPLHHALYLSVCYSFAKAHSSLGKKEGEKLTFAKLECGNTTRAFSYFSLSTIFGLLYSLKEKKKLHSIK